MRGIPNEVIARIKALIQSSSINCPECESVDDEQYQCATCGGDGKINVVEFLKDKKNVTKLFEVSIENPRWRVQRESSTILKYVIAKDEKDVKEKFPEAEDIIQLCSINEIMGIL